MYMEKTQFKLKWSTFLLTSVGLMLAFASVSPAYAARLTPISGNFVFTVTGVISDTVSHGNTIVKYTFSEVLTGSVVGTRTGTGTSITYPDGTVNGHNCGTFVGSVLGFSGTTHDCVTAQGTATSLNVQFLANHGTGELAGTLTEGSAVAVATGPTTSAGTYSGEFIS
jgi:hypothetical protein